MSLDVHGSQDMWPKLIKLVFGLLFCIRLCQPIDSLIATCGRNRSGMFWFVQMRLDFLESTCALSESVISC